MLHMQHHILCNISYVVIAESMGKSLKYTTIKPTPTTSIFTISSLQFSSASVSYIEPSVFLFLPTESLSTRPMLNKGNLDLNNYYCTL